MRSLQLNTPLLRSHAGPANKQQPSHVPRRLPAIRGLNVARWQPQVLLRARLALRIAEWRAFPVVAPVFALTSWVSLPLQDHSQQPQQQPALLPRLQAGALALVATAALALGAPSPALAEIQTVSATEATQMAKPLKQQPVNKGRIWLLMVLGGTTLFGSTVLLENNETFFPAITKANRALKSQKKQQVGRGLGDFERAGCVEGTERSVVRRALGCCVPRREQGGRHSV